MPKGTERFQTGHEAAGLGKGAPWMELDAFLQVPTVERFTPYLSAIQFCSWLPHHEFQAEILPIADYSISEYARGIRQSKTDWGQTSKPGLRAGTKGRPGKSPAFDCLFLLAGRSWRGELGRPSLRPVDQAIELTRSFGGRNDNGGGDDVAGDQAFGERQLGCQPDIGG